MASSDYPLQPEPPALAEPGPPLRDPVWTGRDVFTLVAVALVVFVGLSLAIGVYIAIVYPGKKFEEVPGMPLLSILAQAFTSSVVLGSMYWLVARRYRSPFWDSVRWKWPAGSLIFLCAFGGVAMALMVDFASALAPVPKSLPIYKFFETPAAAYAMAGYGIFLAPVIEELFFRGFLFPVLARRSGVPTAVLLTSVAFMAIHVEQLAGAWLPLVILFFVGMAFTLARAWSGSVAVSYLMHVGYNATLFAGMFLSTDFFRHLERMTE